MFKAVHGDSLLLKVDRLAEQRILSKRATAAAAAMAAAKILSNGGVTPSDADSARQSLMSDPGDTPPPSLASSTLTLGTMAEECSKQPTPEPDNKTADKKDAAASSPPAAAATSWLSPAAVVVAVALVAGFVLIRTSAGRGHPT